MNNWTQISILSFWCDIIEPPHGKTNNLHRRKQRRISAFVFATQIVQFLFYLNQKFQASSSFLCLYSWVCVGPVRKPHCWFSHEAAHMLIKPILLRSISVSFDFLRLLKQLTYLFLNKSFGKFDQQF